ncbi:hypothetical protein [Fibrobacter sp.]
MLLNHKKIYYLCCLQCFANLFLVSDL